jgi:hypothetical protein
MAKERMMAGFTLKQTGVITPNEPIVCAAQVPQNAVERHFGIDAKGNFVLFCEVWSHPEGTKVNHREVEYLIAMTGKVLPAGSWKYHSTVMAGPAIFHVFTKSKLEIIV